MNKKEEAPKLSDSLSIALSFLLYLNVGKRSVINEENLVIGYFDLKNILWHYQSVLIKLKKELKTLN